MSFRSNTLSLLNVLIIVACLAGGLFLAWTPYTLMNWGTVPPNTVSGAMVWAHLIYPTITPLTLALPWLSLRQPTMRRARLFRQPGATACLAASVVLLIRALELLPVYQRGVIWRYGPIHPWLDTSLWAGFAVLGTWTLLATGIGRRPRKCGLDSLGTALGLLWIWPVVWSIVRVWLGR